MPFSNDISYTGRVSYLLLYWEIPYPRLGSLGYNQEDSASPGAGCSQLQEMRMGGRHSSNKHPTWQMDAAVLYTGALDWMRVFCTDEADLVFCSIEQFF